jgi:hypothetical protein
LVDTFLSRGTRGLGLSITLRYPDRFAIKAARIAALMTVLGCADSVSRPGSGNRDGPSSGAATANGQCDAGTGGPGVPVPGEFNWRELPTEPGAHRYRSGGSLCCAEGECTACCSSYDGRGSCVQHGGIYGACLREGQTGEFKFHCVHCCPGLMRSSRVILNAQGLCEEVGTPSLQTCYNCGDSICSEHENSCTCPQDCMLPDGGVPDGPPSPRLGD